MAERTDFEKALAGELGIEPRVENNSILDQALIAFFSQHYRQKTEIQNKAISPIYFGKNALVLSATASGKTEAAVCPVSARILSQKENALCLYVAPTKALLNDLVRRLETPLKRLGLKLLLKHGDHDPPLEGKNFNFLFTTPESLDVLLCKRIRALERVKHVIVDEIHQMYNQPRGFQLLFLLERLKLLTKKPLQRIALSATVAQPSMLAAWLKGSDEDLEIFATEGKREITSQFLLVKHLQSLRTWFSSVPVKKVLVFANTRRKCEEIFLSLKGVNPYEAFVHYSTLEKPDREYVENKFKKSVYAACVATTTMELGVDIGSVDAVVLAAPPYSVSSFLQRIGRGGRRTAGTHCHLVAQNDWEFLQHCALLRLAQEGALEATVKGYSYSVLVQQIFSYVASKPDHRILPEEILNFCRPWAEYPTGIEAIVSSLETRGYLIKEANWRSLRMGPKLSQLYNKAMIFSNIRDTGKGVPVVCRGRKLGILPLPRDVGSGDTILFAGRYWKVENVDESSIKVTPGSPVTNPLVPRWSNAGLETSDLVLQEIKRLLKCETEPRGVEQNVKDRLENIRRNYLGGSTDWDFLYRQKDGKHIYYTFLGGFSNTLLQMGFESGMKPPPEIHGRELRLISDLPLDFSCLPKINEIKELIGTNWKIFSDIAAKGPYFNLLPSELQKEETLSFLNYEAIEAVSKLVRPRLLRIDREF